MTRLQEYYIKNVIPELIKKFNYGNIHQVPKLKKAKTSNVTHVVGLSPKLKPSNQAMSMAFLVSTVLIKLQINKKRASVCVSHKLQQLNVNVYKA